MIANNALLIILIATSGFWDLKERRIPNTITFTGIMLGILINLMAEGGAGLMRAILGLFAGLASFFCHL